MNQTTVLETHDILTAAEPQADSGGIPETAISWLAISVAHALRGDVAGPLRQMETQALRHMAANHRVASH